MSAVGQTKKARGQVDRGYYNDPDSRSQLVMAIIGSRNVPNLYQKSYRCRSTFTIIRRAADLRHE